MCMFNVTLPWDDPSNKLLGEPEKYEPIKPSYFRYVRNDQIRKGEHYTPHVFKVDNNGALLYEDSIGQMYRCEAQHRGALLSLPHPGHRKDVISIKVFENYIRDNIDSWFRWSKKMMLPVEHMEDLILVTGCTLVTSWAAAVFDGHMSVDSNAATISLEARKYNDGGGAQFFWRNIRGGVEYYNSDFDPNVQGPLPQNQCVFIRGFRAKRTFFRTIPIRAAAEPLPDDPDNHREDKMQVTRIPDGSKYRDPLVGILDYIRQKCNDDISAPEDIIAIAHNDDLRLIEGVETLTADAIERFLHEKKIPLIVENRSAILRDPADNEPPVSHEKKPDPPNRGVFTLGHSLSVCRETCTGSDTIRADGQKEDNADVKCKGAELTRPAENESPTSVLPRRRPFPSKFTNSSHLSRLSPPLFKSILESPPLTPTPTDTIRAEPQESLRTVLVLLSISTIASLLSLLLRYFDATR